MWFDSGTRYLIMKITPLPHGLDLTLSKRFEQFCAGVRVCPSGCWEWQGKIHATGYAQPWNSTFLHRWAYEFFIGPIPEGLVIDHLCRNRKCGNPTHLEPVTQRENSLRGLSISAINATKTHCIMGHAFSPENIYAYKGKRQCRECGRVAWRKWNAKRRTA